MPAPSLNRFPATGIHRPPAYLSGAVSGWPHGSNPHLDDRRPLDVLAHGDLAAVVAAVQAGRTGVYA